MVFIPGGTKRFLFTFTGDPYGSDSLDTELGEREIPDIPLPGDVFYVWTIAPIQESMWLSPNEVRRSPVGEPELVVYDVRVNWNGGKLELIWRQPMPSQIDSIWVTDGYSDWPDNFLRQKVVPGEKFETDNPAITRLRVMVWYNGTPTSVEEFESTQQASIAPNPTFGSATISNLTPGTKRVRVVSLAGVEVSAFTVEEEHSRVDLSSVAPGMYVVSVTDITGTTTVLPLVKQ